MLTGGRGSEVNRGVADACTGEGAAIIRLCGVVMSFHESIAACSPQTVDGPGDGIVGMGDPSRGGCISG